MFKDARVALLNINPAVFLCFGSLYQQGGLEATGVLC